jgi:ketosteroid isomerase-like protein
MKQTLPRPLRLLVLLALPSSCSPSPRAADVAQTRSALQDADRAFNHATAQRRAEGWMQFMAPDGALIRPTGTLTGPAVREAVTKMFADTAFTLTWEPVQADVGASGDLGYTIGHWEAHYRTDKGAPASSTGRYLTIWKQQPDRSWKVVQDIGVTDPGP